MMARLRITFAHGLAENSAHEPRYYLSALSAVNFKPRQIDGRVLFVISTMPVSEMLLRAAGIVRANGGHVTD